MLSASTIENPDKGFDPPFLWNGESTFWGGDSEWVPLSRLPWQIEEMSPLQFREDGLTSKEVAHLLRALRRIHRRPQQRVHDEEALGSIS